MADLLLSLAAERRARAQADNETPTRPPLAG
jgi:hypothetical protein